MIRELLLLKLRLLYEGACVDASAARELERRKPPLRTRSGVSGGIDIVLPQSVHANCRLQPHGSAEDRVVLDFSGGNFDLTTPSGLRVPVLVAPRPHYYGARASDGTPLVEIGQMCSTDRICVGMTRHCVFWKRSDRCHFCSIGANIHREAPRKTVENIAEAVLVAAADPVLPARHVLIGGGTPNHKDGGAVFASDICRAIKRRLEISVYTMIVPPEDLSELNRLRDAGVDELGMNLEFFTPTALERFAPGKFRRIGHDRFYRSLERAVEVFGPRNARSIVIVGLEPPEATIAGAERLASLGVMPILSPFQPLEGSDLAKEKGFSPETLATIYEEVASRCARFGIIPGPTCIACQNNTLSLPVGPGVRYYGPASNGKVSNWPRTGHSAGIDPLSVFFQPNQ